MDSYRRSSQRAACSTLERLDLAGFAFRRTSLILDINLLRLAEVFEGLLSRLDNFFGGDGLGGLGKVHTQGQDAGLGFRDTPVAKVDYGVFLKSALTTEVNWWP